MRMVKLSSVVAFSFQFILYLAISMKAFIKVKEMRNLFNYIQTMAIFLFLASRIFSLVFYYKFHYIYDELNEET